MWDRLIEVIGETGIITQADENVIALYCCAYSDWREAQAAIQEVGELLLDETTGRMYRNPLCAARREAVAAMVSIGASLGLDPAARTRLKIAAAPRPSPVASRNRNDQPPPPPWAQEGSA
jgi:P27 family predicted phage terminase small subunit